MNPDDDLGITAKEELEFETFYRQRLETVGIRPGGSEREELEAARDLLLAVVNDGLTPVADGSVSHVRRDAADWTDPETIKAQLQVADRNNGRPFQPGRPARSRVDMVQGIVVVVVALGILVWFFWPSGAADSGAEPSPETMSTSDGLAVMPTPLPTLEAELLADIIEGAGVKTDLVVPRTLEINGVSFVVQPVKVTVGNWPLPEAERAVSWVYGTVVNYVMGLEATPANRELVLSLGAGDELLLRLSTGATYRFAFVEAIQVAPQASEIFRQTRPGLTLVLLAGDEAQPSRVIVRAAYLPASELAGDPSGGQAQPLAPGQTVSLVGLNLTFVDSRPLVLAETPPGHVTLAVDYRLHNPDRNLAHPTGSFLHRVEADGLTFPLAPGPVSTLPASIPPGAVLTPTALYVVPETALGQALRWSFAVGPAGPGVEVPLPSYQGRLTPVVSVSEASFEDGILVMTLAISSPLRQMTLTGNDLHLDGAALYQVGNYFPWQVAAGGEAQFSLLLTPRANPLRVGLLGYGFEISY
jgi:hypothetical protein